VEMTVSGRSEVRTGLHAGIGTESPTRRGTPKRSYSLSGLGVSGFNVCGLFCGIMVIFGTIVVLLGIILLYCLMCYE